MTLTKCDAVTTLGVTKDAGANRKFPYGEKEIYRAFFVYEMNNEVNDIETLNCKIDDVEGSFIRS